MKVAEIRHLEGIRGDFGISDAEYISISSTILSSDIALTNIEETTEGSRQDNDSFPTCNIQQCERGYPGASISFRNSMG